MPLSSVAGGLARVGAWIVSDKAWGLVESTLGNATECAVAYGLVGSLKWGAALLSIASFFLGVFVGRYAVPSSSRAAVRYPVARRREHAGPHRDRAVHADRLSGSDESGSEREGRGGREVVVYGDARRR
eukprot:8756503-Pyramimonas_sp.AAC.1